jgi:hypothetical protein
LIILTLFGFCQESYVVEEDIFKDNYKYEDFFNRRGYILGRKAVNSSSQILQKEES